MDGSMLIVMAFFQWVFLPLLTALLLVGALSPFRKRVLFLFQSKFVHKISAIPFFLGAIMAWLIGLVWEPAQALAPYFICAELLTGVGTIFRWIYSPHALPAFEETGHAH